MTAIEWCHRPGTIARTWNPTKGCSRVSEGCRHCYAERMAGRIVRMGKGKPTPYDGLVKMVDGGARWTGVVRLVPETLALPLSWRQPSTVFVDSMSDLFHESVTDEQIAAVFGVMAATPHHTYIILTKRADRLPKWFAWLRTAAGLAGLTRLALCIAYGAEFAPSGTRPGVTNEILQRIGRDEWPLPNVWIGVSVENHDAADQRIPPLLATPAAVRLLSCEPLLGPVDLTDRLGVWTSCPDCGRNVSIDEDGCCASCGLDAYHYGVDWVIAGCESGPGARPCDVAWLRSLRDQCAAAGVAFFLKQARSVGDDDLGAIAVDTGSKRKPGGVIGLPYLDGVQHKEIP